MLVTGAKGTAVPASTDGVTAPWWARIAAFPALEIPPPQSSPRSGASVLRPSRPWLCPPHPASSQHGGGRWLLCSPRRAQGALLAPRAPVVPLQGAWAVHPQSSCHPHAAGHGVVLRHPTAPPHRQQQAPSRTVSKTHFPPFLLCPPALELGLL